MAFRSDQERQNYWRDTLRLMLSLLAVWFVVSYGFGILLVDELNTVRFFGFKLGFWFAQQGSIYVFVGLIILFVFGMNRIDRKYDVHEEE